MQDIREESLNESVKSEQSPRVVLWEIDLTVQGGERYFFCNELNEKGEPVTGRGVSMRHTRLTAAALR
ncbi:hypothetical protein HHJ49_15715 [Escherichia coli]|nr:hypothetical protein HHJ49_15715 [Escherichia coli]